ncbi:alanine racemase [Brevundimonas sp. 2R-24]|uniref:Alanine racemase n=2 Tax=Peiella sedimenti TaxID=3061083 RepID=A0ABT8SK10_9CAUL|nr:alanine racemase [Caulobacteraceae bacterium XZ-24]
MTAPAALLTVDLDALAANFHTLRALASGAEVAPVIKADGYGVGAGPAARRLKAEGAVRFFTARLTGGLVGREALGPGPTVYVLDGCRQGDVDALIQSDLTPVLSSLEQVERWRAEGRGRSCVLHVDTGMSRLGLRPEQAQTLDPAGLNVELVMSHLACADEPDHPANARQLDAFRALRQIFPDARRSLANSAGILLGQPYAFDAVRPGIALYGAGPCGHPEPRLKPVATFSAEVLQVRHVKAGETVGYGATFTAERDLTAAVLAVGYADGFSRAHGNGRGAVWLNGVLCPVLGRVSMDLTVVDASDCDVKPGDMGEVFGPNRRVEDAAQAAGTLAYELLTSVSPRVRRRWIGEV